MDFPILPLNKSQVEHWLKEHHFVVKDERFFHELEKIQLSEVQPEEKKLAYILFFLQNCIWSYQYLDKEASAVQISLSRAIAKKYCENGNCVALTERYGCCSGCSHQHSGGCNQKPLYCLTFFCDEVLQKLTKRQKQVLRLVKFEKLIPQLLNESVNRRNK